MKKEERIERYGEGAYEKTLVRTQQWRAANPEKVKELQNETCHKGGKYYEAHELYASTGLQHSRNLLRRNHRQHYQPYKQIIAPESQIHHEWIPGTADYRGTALVETDQHQHGFIDVIRILEGEITMLTEAEIKGELA